MARGSLVGMMSFVHMAMPGKVMAACCAIALLLVRVLPAAEGVTTTRSDRVGQLLNQWLAEGTAEGLKGIYYENRDGQHSPLQMGLYPQLQARLPTDDEIAAKRDKGPAFVVRPEPTIGNCSMSAPATEGGSLPRFYAMDSKSYPFLMGQYLGNNLFVYPEHQDYDIGFNGIGGYGDLYPVNSPCLLTSQGSSSSDMPFVKAMLSAIAAFPPEVRERLITMRMLMPTLQAIFRRSNKQVLNDEEYLTGKAHPAVFDGAQINEEQMVLTAHTMTVPAIPPVVLMAVRKETESIPGRNYFEKPDILTTKLGDSLVQAGRVFRGNLPLSELIVDAGRSTDLLKRPLTLRWSILQGDPQAIRIEIQKDGPLAALRLRWQAPRKNSTGITSHRVDIGVFADNGVSVSAPAIVSIYMLPNEMRFYDDGGRLSEVCYQAHNPDPGLPVARGDLRWAYLALGLSIAGDGLRSRLAEQVLPGQETRKALQNLWLVMRPRMEELEVMEKDAGQKDAAAGRRQALEGDLAAALDKPLESDKPKTACQWIEDAVEALAGVPDLYTAFKPELEEFAAHSTKANASDSVRKQVSRLIDLGVLIEQASGAIATATPVAKLSEAERWYLRGLNLTLLSQVLLPRGLERSEDPAYVDPKLTTPKAWRDVFRYDDKGMLIGWMRYHERRVSWFDAEGRWLPEGPDHPDLAVKVRYEPDAKIGLRWSAVQEAGK